MSLAVLSNIDANIWDSVILSLSISVNVQYFRRRFSGRRQQSRSCTLRSGAPPAAVPGRAS